MSSHSITSNLRKFNDTFSGNLAIFCSDERFVKATFEFLEEDLQVKTCDLLVIAGGPIFITQGEQNLIERLELLLNSHNIKTVLLISHENCGYYKHLYPNLSPLELKNLQFEDLKKALKFLKEKNIEGKAFFAYVEGDQILFKEIE